MVPFFSRKGLVIAATVAVALTCVFGQGCSFVTNETAIQCTSEKECLDRGPAFAGTTCDPTTKTCVQVTADQDLCTSNSQCIDKAGGLAAICRKRDRKCVTLQTPECPTVLAKAGQLVDDNTIVVGAITPAGSVELGDVMEASMALAQVELATQVRGLPDPSGGTTVRPFVILACREFNAGGFVALNTAATHLVKDVNVPLVIGPIDPANANFVLQEVFIPTKTMNILPAAVSLNLYEVPSPIAPTPLMWSAALTDNGTTVAAQEFIDKVLKDKVLSDPMRTNTGPIKIALMQEDNFFGEGGATRMESKLNFNGKNAGDNARDGNYLRVNIGNLIDPVGNPAPEAKIAAAIAAVIDFKPDIVIHAYAPLAIPRTFFNLILQWPPTLNHAYHVDILTTWSSFAPLLDILSAVPPIRSKVFASVARVPPETKARIDQFLIRFKANSPQFRTSNTPEYNLVHLWYDATYMAAYAIVANRARPLTGENIAQTISLLQPPGTPVQTGTEDISKAFAALQSGQGIDLVGLSGHMNLDTRTGAPSPDYDIDITCPSVDPNIGRVTRFVASGFYTANNVGTGAPTNCPTFP